MFVKLAVTMSDRPSQPASDASIFFSFLKLLFLEHFVSHTQFDLVFKVCVLCWNLIGFDTTEKVSFGNCLTKVNKYVVGVQ